MSRPVYLPLLVVLSAVATPAVADIESWTVTAIRFEGNVITREEVLTR